MYLTRPSLKKVSDIVSNNLNKGLLDWGKDVGEKSKVLFSKKKPNKIINFSCNYLAFQQHKYLPLPKDVGQIY